MTAEMQWWRRPCDQARLTDFIAGMEEAARWLDTESAYSGSNRSRWMAEAAKEVRERIAMVRAGNP